MEAELEAEQRRLRETAANMRKYERQYKEIVTQADDDRRQVAELTSLVDQLTIKIKTYKRQIEEAVSICFEHVFLVDVYFQSYWRKDNTCIIKLSLDSNTCCRK